MEKRISWIEYICNITEAVSLRSSCDRLRVGAVIVSPDYEILSTGYNGAPRGVPSCDEVGHQIENGHCNRVVHSEINSIINAAKRGIAIKGGYIFCTHSPCKNCTNAIINSGLKKIYIRELYGCYSHLALLNKLAISVYDWKGERRFFK